MSSRCLDIASISRYLYRLAELEDVLHVEGHVGRCARCRQKLQRMKHYTETLFDDHDPDTHGDSDCPSLIALEHFRRDALQERQMIRIQSHLRSCPVCREWIQQREPETAIWEVPTFLLPVTRGPDLDLRVAQQGVRIAAGAERLDLDRFPTLMQRLDLRDPGQVTPAVTIRRSVHFRMPQDGWDLRGRVDFLGYEGFRLTLHVPGRPQGHRLCLWTRTRVHARWELAAGGGEVSSLLMPGHYFVGSMPDEEPMLAVSVEPELLTPEALAACGYEACRTGRFYCALACFEQAAQLEPTQDSYGVMRQRTLVLARRFGLADRDVDISWEQPRPQPEEPEHLDSVALGQGGSDAARVVDLVDALRRQERLHAPSAAMASVVVSRQRFRPAFASLMLRLWDWMQGAAGSVESPTSHR